MNISILGAGNVGEALGVGWVKAGHAVTFAVRNPADAKYDGIRKAGAAVATVADAVGAADIVVLATPWDATQSIIEGCGGLAGKTVFDCTNPLGAGLKLTVGHTDSGGEMVARWAPQARVVKIFNTTGFGNMANPKYGDHASVMFYAGDDAAAKKVAHQLAADLGFDPLDAGPLSNARLLEPLACLSIDQAVMRGLGRDFAFVIHRR